jgi:hypothetical protein
MSLNNNNNHPCPSSFYIPRIHTKWTEGAISGIFEYEFIGKVDRVDFGKTLEKNSQFRTAFVHIDYYFSGAKADAFLQSFSQAGVYRFYPMPSCPEFWILLPNKKPVYRTHMNIHQLAALCENQEKAIQDLREEIQFLKERQNKTFYSDVCSDGTPKLRLNIPQTPPDYYKTYLTPPAPRSNINNNHFEEASDDSDIYSEMPELISVSEDE